MSATLSGDTELASHEPVAVVAPGAVDLLVVDDEPDFADLVSEIASGLDLSTCVFYDVDAFKQRFDPGIRFVVLDLNMPDCDGIELIRWLAEQGCGAALVLMSGMSDRILKSAREVAEARGLTVLGCITKPFRIKVLEDLLAAESRQDQPKVAVAKRSFSVEQVVDAIERRQIVPHYQPKVDLAAGGMAGVETLARWEHPDQGLVFPGDFLPQVREAGIEDRLMLRMLDGTLADLVRWKDAGLDVVASINVEPSCLSEVGFPDLLLSHLDGRGVPADRILLEVTESAVLEHLLNAVENMLRLRMKGVGFAIDDFGTGHANMSQLCNMPFTQLKVDRSFVSRIETSDEAAIIVESNIDLAHRFGLEVVAEGVEQAGQARRLLRAGCDQIQGFLISGAVPGDAVPDWAHDWQVGAGHLAWAERPPGCHAAE